MKNYALILLSILSSGIINAGHNQVHNGHLHASIVLKLPTALESNGLAATGYNPVSLSFSPINKLVAIINQKNSPAASFIQIFGFNNAGTLTPKSSLNINGFANSVSWAPSGNFIAETNGNAIEIFNVSLQGVVSGPISKVGSGLGTLLISWAPYWSPSTGGFIAAVDRTSLVKIFKVNASGTILSPFVSSKSSGIVPSSVTWSPNWSPTNGGLIAVVSQASNTIQTFRVNTSGVLSEVISTQFTGLAPCSVAWSPNGDFIAVANANGNSVQIFSVSNNGNLSKSAMSSQLIESAPNSIAWSPEWSSAKGGSIAVATAASNSVQIFNIDSYGNISASRSSYANTVGQPQSVAWSPSGNLIAVANATSNTIQTFSVDS